MTYEEAFLSELNKIAQGVYGGYPGQMVATQPPAPSILKSPKLQKAVDVGKRVGMSSLKIADKFLREPVKSFSRPSPVPRSLL